MSHNIERLVRYSPREIPELRANLAEKLPEWAAIRPDSVAARSICPYARDIGDAEMYFMSEDFVSLVHEARKSMPEHDITRFDPPARSGLVLKPTAALARVDGRAFQLEAGYLWVCTEEGIVAGGVMSRQLFDADMDVPPDDAESFPKLLPLAELLPYGPRPASSADLDRFCEHSLRDLFVFWNLLRQKTLVETTDAPVPRPERRRLSRAGHAPSPPVRLVHLRTSAPSASASSHTEREWRHRWVVRGHWRQQWFPSMQDHRPVWIAPHIKGPEDAPLLGGHKVYVADGSTVPAEVTS